MNKSNTLEANHIVELQNIYKTYHIGKNILHALTNISLQIVSGEFIAIWGPSGSGKTTLLNIIGLIDIPTQGKMFINGNELKGISDNYKSDMRNTYIGYVFQAFNLVPVLSALENVALPLEIRGLDQKKAKEKAEYRLDQLGLSQHKSQKPDKLSGGQKQRVAIARALVTSPQIIIADEPTANLDSQTSENIILEMKNINNIENTTFIFATHDSRLLTHVSRRILLKDGQIQNSADD